MLLAIVSPAGMARRVVTHSPGSRLSRQQSCDVDAPQAYVDDVRGAWCGEALVTKVSLKTDTRNYVARVQLSDAASSAWMTSAGAISAQVREILDGIAERLRMNIAVTLLASDGTPLAACTRDLIAAAASCTAR
jgi:hypothetical protein